jgi:O-antigen ligase
MTPDTLDFTGNAVTYLGLLGIMSTLLIVVTCFRRFYNSPYNIRVTPKVTQETPTEITES